MNRSLSLLAVGLCLAVIPSLGQEKAAQETVWRVPELDRMHEPIAALWHEAWPNKDLAKLNELLPDVEKAYKDLAAVTLPGILREKKGVWEEKLGALGESVKSYRTAVTAGTLQPILDAVEKVHSGYEAMVRVIRPALKELDAFHQVLYLVHHYEMPAGDVAKLKASADSLTARMALLNAAVLPERLKNKDAQFQKARTALAEAVASFADAVKKGTSKEELQKIELGMHGRYQVLENVFE
jgi:hypothetical protein